MTRRESTLLNTLLLLACLTIGTQLGGWLQSRAVAATVIDGDFSALRRETGTDVVLFSTSTCPHCRATRAFLDREHIRYTDFVIDQSQEAEARFTALDGDAVPLLLIGDRAVRGFQEDRFREALAMLADKSITNDSRSNSAEIWDTHDAIPRSNSGHP